MQSMHVNQRRVRPLVANCVHAIKLSATRSRIFLCAGERDRTCLSLHRHESSTAVDPSSFLPIRSFPSKFSNPNLSFSSFAHVSLFPSSSHLSNPYQPMEFALILAFHIRSRTTARTIPSLSLSFYLSIENRSPRWYLYIT